VYIERERRKKRNVMFAQYENGNAIVVRFATLTIVAVHKNKEQNELFSCNFLLLKRKKKFELLFLV